MASGLTSTKTNRARSVERVLWIVLALNLVVAAAKFAYGLVSQSASMQADGIHSLFDSVGNVVGLVGIALAARPADEGHPYGHSKFETYGSLAIGVVFGRAMKGRWFARYSMAVGWVASAVGMLVVGLAPTFPVVVLGSVVQGFGTGTFMPTMVGIIGNVAGKQNASMVLGISMGLVGASQFFGPTVFNMATEALHLAAGGPCITLAAAVQLGFALVASLVLVRARRRKGGEG